MNPEIARKAAEMALAEIQSPAYAANKDAFEAAEYMRKNKKSLTPAEEAATAPMSFEEMVERNAANLFESYQSEKAARPAQNPRSGFMPVMSGDIGGGSGA